MTLAIVIPAFKSQFLEKTLLSISKQTDKDFTVYIGDDNSPENLQRVVSPFVNDLKILYKKFDTNLGSINLTLSWERCIELAQNEEWIWLFSDDDIMDPDCVSRFKDALVATNSKYDLYRFNTKVIDNNGNIIQHNTIHPHIESSYQFAIERLKLRRNSYVVEYIFLKKRYLESGKFVSFPLAWSSDEATWIRIAANKDIFTIAGPHVYWRYSFLNISSLSNLGDEKIEATVQYLNWLKHWISIQYPTEKYLSGDFKQAKFIWLKHQVMLLGKQFSILESLKLSRSFKRRLEVPISHSLSFFASLRISAVKQKLKKNIKLFIKTTA
jgi:glycosyltransferase involved in cell wall biosynthesis